MSLLLPEWSYRDLPLPSSPTDSGYASSPNSPTSCNQGLSKLDPAPVLFQHVINLRSRIKQQYDGPADDSKPYSASLRLPRKRPSASPIRGRPLIRTFKSSSSARSAGSITSPDRFLATRRPTLNALTESFRTNKDPAFLTSDEKLLRHDGASQDAFNPHRRQTALMHSALNPPPRRSVSGSRSGGASILTFQRDSSTPNGQRHVSIGTVWSVGGVAPISAGVSNGRGGLLGHGTTAPLYTTTFTAARPKAYDDFERHEGRLAQALELDRTQRVLEFRDLNPSPPKLPQQGTQRHSSEQRKTVWRGGEWILGGPVFILDAPNLRDDFYCSVLAFSPTSRTLAVGLGSLLYVWSEDRGVNLINNGAVNGSWLTSLAFSSFLGGSSILAFGRSDGTLNLMSLNGTEVQPPRFEVQQPSPIACITWRPLTTQRPSRSPFTPGMLVKTEDLLVGDEIGNTYYYAVEWPEATHLGPDHWSGSMTLLVRISAHTQQICGLSFSCDGSMFATGGNDNLCCLFRTMEVLRNARTSPGPDDEVFIGSDGVRRAHTVVGRGHVKDIPAGAEKHRWVHGAAVKAIAFCPWRDGLVATGGGSNDKCIHFYHTSSGACLATISVSAQVTSLIWSTTRREIAATFGYAQPEHPFRIAVFSWPDCKQVAAIPWEGEHRALYAIAYPGGPNESQTSREGSRGLSRTAKEGCIVVASSDESVKFHEVWTAAQKSTIGGEGLLGGSDILEELEGIEKEAEVIR